MVSFTLTRVMQLQHMAGNLPGYGNRKYSWDGLSLEAGTAGAQLLGLESFYNSLHT